MTLREDADTSYVPGDSDSEKLPRLSVRVDFDVPSGVAVTVAPATGRGGHGRSGRSTGHVGPATTEPLTPEPAKVAPGGSVGAGVRVVSAVSLRPQATAQSASATIRNLVAPPGAGRGPWGSS